MNAACAVKKNRLADEFVSAKIPVTHVYPTDGTDLRDHEIGDRTGACWCKPTIEYTDRFGTTFVLHNSMDGREKLERFYDRRRAMN